MTFTNTFKRKACRVIAALAAVACTMSLAACGADETGKIRIGIKFDQPGLGFKKSGTYVGFDVDVAKYVAKKLGYSEDQIIWKEAPSKQREAMIQNGDVDMILATYSITDERKKAVSFAGPYFVAGQDLLVRKDDNSINGPEDRTASAYAPSPVRPRPPPSRRSSPPKSSSWNSPVTPNAPPPCSPASWTR